MENDEKLDRGFPMKLSEQMDDALIELAGGRRKRAEYVRQLIAKEIAEKQSSTEKARIRAEILSMAEDLGEQLAVNALRKETRAQARKCGR